MDSRAKQRVTGAVILAALFVLLVPELLTGPRTSTTPAAPEEEQGLRSYVIEVDGQSAGSSSPSQVAQPAAAAPATPIPAPDNDDAAPRVAEPAPARPPEQRSAAAADVPSPASSAPREASPTPAAPARSEPPRPAATQSAPPAAKGSFVVQLGSFGSRDNADRLVRDMSAKGFKAFVAPIRSGGRDLYRVRVGPTPDRASAEALAADLKRVGQSGSIVPIS